MELAYQEYRARKIVNVRRHVDGPWFWDKYSASPYVGCRSGCEFCYIRGGYYLGRRDPNSLDTLIQVKVNAVDLLRQELPRLEPDVITCGDWQQPAEDKYRLSRQMLEVILELGFPLFIVERSPLLARDIDLLEQINQRAWVGVVISLSNLDPDLKQAFEPRSPGMKRRLKTMQALAKAGIQVGTALMPVIPIVGDDEAHLEDAILATADHGGSFVLGGGLTMDGLQAERTLAAAIKYDPAVEASLRAFYDWEQGGKPNSSPPAGYAARLGLRIRDLCAQHGLKDRMPRHIVPGPLAINKRLAERLFLRSYDLELEQAKSYRIWAYRKAAWTVDELQESVADIFREERHAGLRKLPAIGQSLAQVIGDWLSEPGENPGGP